MVSSTLPEVAEQQPVDGSNKLILFFFALLMYVDFALPLSSPFHPSWGE